uniref:Proton-associated sugar transporter A n=1 Tax=Clastoptera arizonana TaxID=38151 RepID=A0A1B6D576_9HEMI
MIGSKIIYRKTKRRCRRMVEKLHEYQGCLGRLHSLRDSCKTRWDEWRDSKSITLKENVKNFVQGERKEEEQTDYSHVYRRKTRGELIRISAAVMGIEFSYAAETAFVSPILLKIGVDHQHMTFVWALSPIIGFFLTPVLGSMSDRCRLKWGRRRPFILLLALGVLLGLMLVPNGENIGYALGDCCPKTNVTSFEDSKEPSASSRPWGIIFTALGTALMDFDADACQSPARAYLLDVTVVEDHGKGLSTFTIMAGLGGFMGYALGGFNWEDTVIGLWLGGQVKAVFTLITFIFIICVVSTITSFREQPLDVVEGDANSALGMKPIGSNSESDLESCPLQREKLSYGTVEDTGQQNGHIDKDAVTKKNENDQDISKDHNKKPETILSTEAHKAANPSLTQYLMSIIFMPKSLRILCLTNLFCWMAHVCYSLYFTDFVGESIFGGDPKGPEGSEVRILYEEGVRFGCWGMSMYSLSCACYSFVIERLIKKFRAKTVYVGGLLFYSIGMFLMAALKHKISVIVFSWTAGVMYSTLFTMPYLLIANYHATNIFEVNEKGERLSGTQLRGLGTDVAIVSSMVFLAQFILSICMGYIVSWAETTTAVVTVAAFLSFCGSIAATQVMYLDL